MPTTAEESDDMFEEKSQVMGREVDVEYATGKSLEDVRQATKSRGRI